MFEARALKRQLCQYVRPGALIKAVEFTLLSQPVSCWCPGDHNLSPQNALIGWLRPARPLSSDPLRTSPRGPPSCEATSCQLSAWYTVGPHKHPLPPLVEDGATLPSPAQVVVKFFAL